MQAQHFINLHSQACLVLVKAAQQSCVNAASNGLFSELVTHLTQHQHQVFTGLACAIVRNTASTSLSSSSTDTFCHITRDSRSDKIFIEAVFDKLDELTQRFRLLCALAKNPQLQQTYQDVVDKLKAALSRRPPHSSLPSKL